MFLQNNLITDYMIYFYCYCFKSFCKKPVSVDKNQDKINFMNIIQFLKVEYVKNKKIKE